MTAVWFRGPETGDYAVRIDTSVTVALARILRARPRRCAIVTEPHVRRLWWPRLARSLRAHGVDLLPPVVIPTGENAKSLRVLEHILHALLRRGLDRDSCILALGGGAVTDVAGFAAATYMRGIDWVAVPTSLLGMVDAAVGGKVGANLRRTKNAVGAFHPPLAVLAGTEFLRTLSPRERRSGLGEVVKYAMIADRRLFEQLEHGAPARWGRAPQADAKLVARCCRIKARFVCQDPRERGVRASLNFGHTVAHALEAETSLRLAHGEAVGLGMLVACSIAEEIGVAREPMRARLEAVLLRLGLPTHWPRPPRRARLRRFLARDKKAREGTLRFVLTPRIGSVSVGHVVGTEVLERALDRLDARVATSARARR
ncbi:MAG TPA: 3-dehydroquinate synthase [Candidatus Krumholzibacteria bacterium]|nr:3-dehydroquinate synthase [Candidatus Krumholzibacteria bacterium]